jgi:carbonic anhydrase
MSVKSRYEGDIIVKKRTILVVLPVWLLLLVGLVLAVDQPANVTPDEAIHRLVDGNLRFLQGKSVHPNNSSARVVETGASGQHPFAAVLSCSDSRVPLEILFDQGIGDIFVIRVAGNICGVNEMGSIEYAVEHVGTPLFLVLGHTECGAVKAAATNADTHGNIKLLVDQIGPAVSKAQSEHPDLHGIGLVPAVTEANVWHSIEELFKHSLTTRQYVQSGKLKVIAAVYDVKSGQIRWLGEHPLQSKLLSGSHKQQPDAMKTDR